MVDASVLQTHASLLDRFNRPAEALQSWDRALQLARGDASIVSIRISRLFPLIEIGKLELARIEADELGRHPQISGGMELYLAAALSRLAEFERKQRHTPNPRAPADAEALRHLRHALEHRYSPESATKILNSPDWIPLRNNSGFLELCRERGVELKPLEETLGSLNRDRPDAPDLPL